MRSHNIGNVSQVPRVQSSNKSNTDTKSYYIKSQDKTLSSSIAANTPTSSLTTSSVTENKQITETGKLFPPLLEGQLTLPLPVTTNALTPLSGGQRIDHSQKRFLLLKIEEEKKLPGKPVASSVRTDAVTLTWEPPSTFSSDNYYQLMYKEIDQNKYWKNCPDKIYAESAEVDGLRSNTAFVFRVRTVYVDGDGPLSVESDQVVTLESTACRYTERSVLLQRGDPSPYVFAVPMIETEGDDRRKVFEIGTRPLLHCESKTIVLLGDHGAGKSTLIDAIINYVLGVSWDDPYRFTVKQSKDEFLSKTQSHKERWTKYTIYPEKEGRLQYTLNVIDTHEAPSLIAFHTNPYLERDVNCFVIRASDARLTAQHRRVLNGSFFNFLFPRKAEADKTTFITFADGNIPPVLSALNESGLHFGEIFKFNNSSLFAKNENFSSLSRVFWDMGFKSFKTFFDHIEDITYHTEIDLFRKSNKNQKFLQTVMKESQLDVVKVLMVAGVLEQSINNIKINQSLKGSYRLKDVPETFTIIKELQEDEHAMNCLSCQRTCNTFSRPFENAEACRIVFWGERCNDCKRNCPQERHFFSKFFKFENVEIKTRYEEITKEDKDTLQIVDELAIDLRKLKHDLYKIARSLITCDKRLKHIDDLPKSYVIDTNKYIEGMIEDEIRESKEGF